MCCHLQRQRASGRHFDRRPARASWRPALRHPQSLSGRIFGVCGSPLLCRPVGSSHRIDGMSRDSFFMVRVIRAVGRLVCFRPGAVVAAVFTAVLGRLHRRDGVNRSLGDSAVGGAAPCPAGLVLGSGRARNCQWRLLRPGGRIGVYVSRTDLLPASRSRIYRCLGA